MKITILTLFPEMFDGPFAHSIIKRAIADNKLELRFSNIREFGIGKHKVVDDTPYGGGVGMVMRADVLFDAIEDALDKSTPREKQKVVLLDPHGRTFSQRIAKEYAVLSHLILICAHYEGVDERIKSYIDEELSIGDFIVTGGEIPAMLVTDAVARLKAGILKEEATKNESFSPLLEYPHYTKPQVFNGTKVPDVLLSGNHARIEEWRRKQAVRITKKLRPDLLTKTT